MRSTRKRHQRITKNILERSQGNFDRAEVEGHFAVQGSEVSFEKVKMRDGRTLVIDTLEGQVQLDAFRRFLGTALQPQLEVSQSVSCLLLQRMMHYACEVAFTSFKFSTLRRLRPKASTQPVILRRGTLSSRTFSPWEAMTTAPSSNSTSWATKSAGLLAAPSGSRGAKVAAGIRPGRPSTRARFSEHPTASTPTELFIPGAREMQFCTCRGE